MKTLLLHNIDNLTLFDHIFETISTDNHTLSCNIEIISLKKYKHTYDTFNLDNFDSVIYLFADKDKTAFGLEVNNPDEELVKAIYKLTSKFRNSSHLLYKLRASGKFKIFEARLICDKNYLKIKGECNELSKLLSDFTTIINSKAFDCLNKITKYFKIDTKSLNIDYEICKKDVVEQETYPHRSKNGLEFDIRLLLF